MEGRVGEGARGRQEKGMGKKEGGRMKEGKEEGPGDMFIQEKHTQAAR